MTLHTLIILLIKVYPKWEGYKKKNPPYRGVITYLIINLQFKDSKTKPIF